MVTSVTSLGRSGVADWLVQRVSAVILAVYTVVVLGWLVSQGEVSYEAWSAFMGCAAMKIANTFVIVSICAHAWIGLWTVTTDYLTTRQIGSTATGLRLLVQLVIALLTLVFLLWGLMIIWGGV
ncbi:MAG: succinate dehydrogenase, hydrophobic membrane anchor protein [Alcanivoracaceae bacterium]